MNSNPRALISVGIIYKIEINFPYLSKDVSRMQIWKRNTFQEASNVFSMMTEFQESFFKLYTYIYIYYWNTSIIILIDSIPKYT